MKKFRLLLLALAVIALLVAGLSITVSADATVLTVNGTAYTASNIPSEIPDGAEVVVSANGTIPYNPKATYVLAYQCSQIYIYDSTINFNTNSSNYVQAGIRTLVACNGVNAFGIGNYKFYAAQELPTEYPELNLVIPQQYQKASLKVVDSAKNTARFINATTNLTPTADTVVTVFGTTGAISCVEGVEYVIPECSAAAFSATDSSNIRFADMNNLIKNLSCEHWKSSEKVIVKLLKDVTATRSGALGAIAYYGNATEIHFDLNGHKLINLDTTSLGSYTSGTNVFLGTGGTDGKGIDAGQHLYIYSSEPGGELRHHVTVNGQVGSHYIFAGPNNGASIHFGAAEVDGKKISGDNLTVYGGLLASSKASDVKVFVDGGTYYNTVSTDGRYLSSLTYGAWGEGTEFNIKNAKFYSASGKFIAQDNAAVSNAVFNIDNCDFYSNGARGAFCLHPGQTLNVSNSSFYQANASETFVYCPASATAPTVSFTNCVMSDGFLMNANVKDKLIDANGTIEIAHGESFKIPTVAFAEGSTTELVNSYTPMGTLSYSKFLTSKIFAEHNISLGSDPVYNLYVPKCISDISVKLNGVEHSYTIKSYDETRNVISIAVGAKNTLDDIVVSCTAGELTDSITSNLMAYVDQARGLYPDDARLQSLLLAVKDYSKAAAEYFGYNADAFSYEYSENLEALVLESKKLTLPSDAFLAKIDGARLRLDGEIAFVFSVAEGASGEATLNYLYGGKEKSETVTLDGKTEIEISVKARDLNRGVTITVNGESLTYGLQNYVYAMSKYEALDEGKKAALMKLLAYMTGYCSDACPGHVETDAVIGNDVEPGAETAGSYDKMVFCSECDSVISRQTFIIPALLDGFTYDKNGDNYVISNVAYDGERTDIVLPVGVTSVPELVFKANANITSVVFPEGLTQLSANQFYNCKSLKSVTLPSTLKTISLNAFYMAGALESLTIPASVTSINVTSAFTDCHSLKSITVEDGNTAYKSIDGVLFNFDGTQLIHYPANDDTRTEYTVPNGVTSIVTAAFKKCQYLTTVNLPDSITEIGAYCFSESTKLQGLMVFSGPLTLGSQAFNQTKAYGSKLEIVLPKDVKFTNREFQNSNALVYYTGTKEEWSALANVQTTHYNNQSYDATNRVFFCEPESPVEGATYWRMDDGIPTTYVSDGKPTIHRHTPLDAAIENERPATPTTNGSYDLVIRCSECGEIISKETVTVDAFLNDFDYTDNGDGTYTVTGLKDASVTEVVVPDCVTAIGASAFSGTAITSAIIPSSVTSMGNSVFYNCRQLEYVEINASITELPTSTLASCYKLKLAILPETLTTIVNSYAFNGTAHHASNTIIVLPKSFVKFASTSALKGAKANFFYAGTEADWQTAFPGKTLVNYGGDSNTALYYYSESTPTTAGNYWHYDANGTPVAW